MDELEQPTGWSLDDLFAEPAGQHLDEAIARLEQSVCDFEAMRESLKPAISTDQFDKVLAKVEEIAQIKARISAYADLSFSADTQSPLALGLRDRVADILADAGNRCLFFDLWFKDLPDETAERLIAAAGDLHYYLETIRRFKPYTLTEAEEKIITTKDVNGIDALVNLYEMITNQFRFTIEVDGEKKTVNHDELTGYYDNPSAEVRAAAYHELYRVYQENSAVLAQMYIHRVRDWHAEGAELRGYPSPIAPRNLDNDLPEAVVDTLLSVCRSNAGLFQRYFRLKGRWLGLPAMRRYDIYASLAPSEKLYDFAVGKKMVLDSYSAFSPIVSAFVKRVFDDHHLDSEVRSGKHGGAFCYTALPELTPWVLIHYDRRAHDITTLAHELGHAVHNMLAAEHSVMTQQASLPLAETASVFGEMLLTDRLLQQEQEPSVRHEILARAMDDAYLTVMRQAYFTIFEKQVHAMIVEGKTVDEIAEAYLANLHEQFGDALEVPEEFKWEWISVPHMYEVPFYTYAYSFGQMLVLALYQQYKLEGEDFLPRYLRILSYGGSETPLKVLTEAGLDVTSPAFWQGGFDFLERMLAELEQLS